MDFLTLITVCKSFRPITLNDFFGFFKMDFSIKFLIYDIHTEFLQKYCLVAQIRTFC
jgi:hypothetical protein